MLVIREWWGDGKGTLLFNGGQSFIFAKWKGFCGWTVHNNVNVLTVSVLYTD